MPLPCGCNTGILCPAAQALWREVQRLWRQYQGVAIRGIASEKAKKAWDAYISARQNYQDHFEYFE